MLRRALLAAALGGLLTSSVAAQTLPAVPLLQAGADGRYETQLDPKRAVPGRSAAQVAAFRAEVDRLIAHFAALPEVTSPPSPVCHRLKSWIEVQSFHGPMAAEVGVMAPISFANGRCHRMTGTGVVARVNSLSLLLDPQEAFLRIDGGPSDWFLLPQGAVQERTIRIRDAVAFTHGRAALLRPVSAERYLAERLRLSPASDAGGELARWLAEGKPKALAEAAQMLRELKGGMSAENLAKIAEGQRVSLEAYEAALRDAASSQEPTERDGLLAVSAALPAAARNAPACLLPGTLALDPTPGCPDGLTLVELNPDYFDPGRPTTIQLLVIETPGGRTHGENDQRLSARRAVWDAVDHEALAALVR